MIPSSGHTRPAPRAASDVGAAAEPPGTSRPALHTGALQALLCTYAALVLYATLLPFRFDAQFDLPSAIARVAWNPFQLGAGTPTPLYDVLANIGFFIPVGLLYWATRHAWQHGRRSAASALLLSAVIGASLSIAVEASQIWTTSRSPATSDVLANTAGALLGALLAAGLGQLFGRAWMRGVRHWLRHEALAVPFVGLVFLHILNALVPFDVTWQPQAWLRAAGETRFFPWHEGSMQVLPLDPLLAGALFGGVADRVLLRRAHGGRRAALVLGLAFAWAVWLEVLQLGIRSQVTSWYDVLGMACGAAVGLSVSRTFESRRSSLAHKLLVLYALSLVVITLYPIERPLDAAAIRERVAGWLPHAAFPEAANRSAVHELFDVLVLYVPFGYLAAAAASPSRLRWVSFLTPVILACAGLSLTLGLLRAILPGGTASPGHVIPATLGGLVGAFVALGRNGAAAKSSSSCASTV